MPGSFALNAEGQATYTVPIWAPTGRAGLEPSLNLTYNSGAPSGPLGVGWALAGFPISVISRCKTSVAIDGDSGPIDFAGTTYCLDGERLLPVSPNASEFRTEVDKLSRVVLNGPLNAPTKFTVYAKNGLVLTYGSQDNSRLAGERPIWTVAPTDSNPPVVSDMSPGTFAWGLDTVTDRVGNIAGNANNVMTITYMNYSVNTPRYPYPLRFVEFLPQKIQYNKDASSGGLATVEFIYQGTRPDTAYTFVSGLGIRQSAELTRIEVSGPNPSSLAILRSYDLTYETAPVSGRPRLRKIVECDQFHACKNPMIFDWENGSDQYAEIVDPAPMTAVDKSLLLVRDIDGDGKDDIAYSTNAELGSYVYRTSLGTSLSATETPLVAGSRPPAPAQNETIDNIYLTDLDFDGKADLSYIDQVGSATSKTLYSTDPSFPNNTFCPSGQGCMDRFPMEGPNYFGDLDGDGLPELVTAATRFEHPYWLYARNRARTFGTGIFRAAAQPQETDYLGVGPGPASLTNDPASGTPSYMVSLDGSGKQAFLYRPYSDAQRYRSFQLKRSGAPQVTSTTLRISDADPNGRSYVMIDVNGDGLTDALEVSASPYFSTQASQGINLSVNTGTGFTGPATPQGATYIHGVHVTQDIYRFNTERQPGYAIADINQDGLPDIVFMGGMERTEVVALVAAKDFDGLATLLPAGPLTITGGAHIPVAGRRNNSYAFAQVGDFNGDGLVDFIDIPATDPGHFHLYIHQGKKADTLVQISTPLGALTKISYKPLSDPSVHTPASNCNYPLSCLRKGPWVVDSYFTSSDLTFNGSVMLNPFGVRYFGARTDALRGWLGFAKRVTTDGQSNATIVTTFDNTTKIGTAYPYAALPQQEVVIARETATGPFHRRVTINHYETQTLLAPQTFQLRTHDTVVEEQRLVNVPAVPLEDVALDMSQPAIRLSDATTTFGYDINGIVSLERTLSTKGNFHEMAYPSIDNDLGSWLLGAYRKSVETSMTPSGETTIRTTTFEYHPGTLLLKTVTTEPTGDNSLRSVTSYLREAGGHGAVTDIRVTAAATADDPAATVGQPLTRHWVIAYDPLVGVFPVSFTNPAGHLKSFDYDPGLGVMTLVKDPNGVLTTFKYDGFGRPRGVRPPGAGEITIAYEGPPAAPSSVATAYNSLNPKYTVHRAQFGGGESLTTYNHNEDDILRSRKGGDGQFSYQFIGYSALAGQVASTTRWFRDGMAPQPTQFTYDNLRRPLTITLPNGKVQRYAYGTLPSDTGTSTTVTKLNGATTEIDRDELGRLVALIENNRGIDGAPPSQTRTTYEYKPFGLVGSVFPPNDTVSIPITRDYDVLGRPTLSGDPDRGPRRMSYNAFGEVVAEFDANGVPTTYQRDSLGRIVRRQSTTGLGDLEKYFWDTAPNGVGKLAKTVSQSTCGVTKSFGYDYFGRAQSTTWDIATFGQEHQTFVMEGHYDGFGRVSQIDYPSVGPFRLGVHFEYDFAGNLQSSHPWGTMPGGHPNYYWAADARNAENLITSESTGSNVHTQRVYDPQLGLLQSIATTRSGSTLQDLGYEYDDNQNVKARHDRLAHIDEMFRYTDLDMLHQWAVIGPGVNFDTTYTPRGDGTLNGQVTNSPLPNSSSNLVYEYAVPNHAHAVSAVISNPGPSQTRSSLAYDSNGAQTVASSGIRVGMSGNSSFDLPIWVGDANGERMEGFKYGADGNRAYKARFTGGLVSEETFYAGDLYEMRRNGHGVTHIFYIPGADRTVAQETWTREVSGGQVSIQQADVLYFHDDHLGSVDAISSGSGESQAQLKYSPFGRRIDLTHPTETASPFSIAGVARSTVTRGFTFHEMDDETGLINMRGRLFDPALGRFLSPDPVKPSPWGGANYDQYAYVNNNPLNFTDPSGFIRTKIGDVDLSSLGAGNGGGVGFEPPVQMNQANQMAQNEMVDLTGSFMLSGGTVGTLSPSEGGAGPGSMGAPASGPVDDGPPGSGSPVAGGPFPRNNFMGMGPTPEGAMQQQQQLAAAVAAAAATATEALEVGAAAAARALAKSGGVIGRLAAKALFYLELTTWGGDPSPWNTANETPTVPPPAYPGNDGTKAPGADWEWVGTDAPGGEKGAWVNKKTGESLHPDLNHPGDPHWDWNPPYRGRFRIYPDGSVKSK